MSGKIGVTSTEGKGSQFWFTVLLEKQPQLQSCQWDVPIEIQSKRFLIVDPNETSQAVLANQFDFWKCRYQCAFNGNQALDMLKESVFQNDPFHVVLINHFLPDFDPKQLWKKIKFHSELHHVISIMLIRHGKYMDAIGNTALGFSGYLTKPVKQANMLQVLCHALSLQSCRNTLNHDAVNELIHSEIEMIPQEIRILLVEDNLMNQKLSIKILNKYGYNATIASNGKDAIRLLESNCYDVIFMDLQMPEMDGFEATQIIRDPSSKVLDHDVCIIAMTAHAMKEYRDKCIQYGMNDFIAKPIKPIELFNIIKKNIFFLHHLDCKRKIALPN